MRNGQGKPSPAWITAVINRDLLPALFEPDPQRLTNGRAIELRLNPRAAFGAGNRGGELSLAQPAAALEVRRPGEEPWRQRLAGHDDDVLALFDDAEHTGIFVGRFDRKAEDVQQDDSLSALLLYRPVRFSET